MASKIDITNLYNTILHELKKTYQNELNSLSSEDSLLFILIKASAVDTLVLTDVYYYYLCIPLGSFD